MIVVAVIVAQSMSTHTNYCATTDTNLQLSVLSSLPTNQSSTINQNLLNATYWREVQSSADTTLVGILPNTAAGLLSSYQDFRNWTYANLPNPPAWVSTGVLPYLESQVVQLQASLTSSGNSTQARMQLTGYFASIAGANLAGLDFVLFGGITGVETYFDTGSTNQAICATFPGQLAELYILSGSPDVSSNQSAEYLGQALAITSIMVVLAGHDQFTDKFELALDKVGLLDSWPDIKPYLSDVLTRVSQKAAMLMFSTLEVIAQRFPQNAVWYTELTADRMDSMVDLLQRNGVSNADIEDKFQGLLQAAGDAQNGDDVSTDADVDGYQATGQIEVLVRHHSELYLYYDDKLGTEPISAAFLSEVVPGFQPGQPTILRVTYWDGPKSVGAVVYHYYQGGANWVPTVPSDIADMGDVLTISIQVLTEEQFVADLPTIDFYNYVDTDWGATTVSFTGATLTGEELEIHAVQSPAYGGVTGFTIEGTLDGPLSFNGGTTSLDITLTDAFGQTRDIRINFDGHTEPTLGIWDSDSFAAVYFVSFDGYRLRFATMPSPGNIDVATIYANPPSPLYSLGDMSEEELPFAVPYASEVFQIDHVDITRPLETEMEALGTNYDLGRLGAEIAFTVAQEKLGLDDIVMFEPNMGGNDLVASDGTVLIQARMLTSTRFAADPNAYLEQELIQMTTKLHDGFKLYPDATAGYAILTYVDANGVNRVVVVEVLPP